VVTRNSTCEAREKSVLYPKWWSTKMGKLIKTREISKRKCRFSSHSACLASLQRRGMLASKRGRQLLIACGKTTQLQQNKANINTRFLLLRYSVNQAGLIPREGHSGSPEASRRISATFYVQNQLSSEVLTALIKVTTTEQRSSEM